jgi:hypothetical protein
MMTTGLEGELANNRGEAELLYASNVQEDHPESRFHCPSLLVDVYTKPADVGHVKGEVQLQRLLELYFLLIRQDAVNEALRVVAAEAGALRGDELPVNPQHRGLLLRQVQVGGFSFHDQSQQLPQVQ